MEETDERIDLCLNPEVAEKEWLQFLDSFYKLRYTSDYGQADAIKEMSKTNNLQEWIDLADKKQYECYQSDFLQYFPMEIPDNPYRDLYLHLDLVLLSIDGKIFMEGYNDLFAFFTRIIREQRIPVDTAGKGVLVTPCVIRLNIKTESWLSYCEEE